MVIVSLLGAPRIERDGCPVEVDTRKAIALVAYLAVSGRAHTRDALAALLWPERDQEHARGALRRTLSTLRSALGAEWIESSRERIALRRGDGLRIDVIEFRRRLREGGEEQLEEAVELYRGDLLAGFGLRDSVAFDDWQQYEAESLRRELAALLDRLGEERARRGDHGGAIALARRRLVLNPLDEPAHRRLMALHAHAGDRAAALRQYRSCVRVLSAELGVAPVQETSDLHRAIQERRFPAHPHPAPAAAAAPTAVAGLEAPGRAPLIGRADAWARIAESHARASPDGRLVVVEGELGIGKTRLVEDVVAALAREGAATISVRCYEDERGRAYAPVAEAVRAALALLRDVPDHAAEELARLLPEAGASPPRPLESAGAQTRFFESLVRVLREALAGPPPGVLLVEDVHHGDEASLDFLAYLVRRLRGRPLLVLLTWRSDEVGPQHRLRRLLAEVAGAGAATAVRLERLGPEQVEELARRMGAGDAGAGRQVHLQSGGLPLLAVEQLVALGRGEAAPAAMGDLLRARLGSISEVTSQVLTAAAVVGERFAAEELIAAGGRTEEETVAALEELARRGLIDEGGDGYAFRHEQLRAVVYADTSLARRRLLHGRVADALARRPDAAGSLAGQLARHLQLAGRDAEAAEQALRAGRHARSVYANADALAAFQLALALGHPLPGAVQEEAADVHTLAGDYDAALAGYEAAAALTGGAPRVEHKLGALHLRMGEWELAAGHLEAALGATPADDAALRARVLADLSLAAHRQGDAARARALAADALAAAETAGDEPALAQAHNLLGILATARGDAAAARRHLALSLRWARAQPDPGARIAALNNVAQVERLEGDLEGATERTREALALCRRVGDRHREAALVGNLGDLLHAAGRHEEAMAALKEAVTIFAEIGGEGARRPEIWKLVEW